MKASGHLKIKHIGPAPILENLLPLEIARRLHALPIATDGRAVTVAMAQPADQQAAAEIRSAIGRPVYFIQAELEQIQQRLVEIKLQSEDPQLRILQFCSKGTGAQHQDPFLQSITEMLHGCSTREFVDWQGAHTLPELINRAHQYCPDLILVQIDELLSSRRGLYKAVRRDLVGKLPGAVMFPLEPRWPVRKVLLILPDGSQQNQAAVEWAIRFTCRVDASLVVLPLLPPIPAMYGDFLRYRIEDLAQSGDSFGEFVRGTARYLEANGTAASFILRSGEPASQIRQEILEGDPDLVILVRQADRLTRWMAADVIKSVFDCCRQPVLIAKSFPSALSVN